MSFLATGCLNQLALQNAGRYTLESTIISSDFYVNDLKTGCSSIDSFTTMCLNITKTLKEGSFELRKFSSNAHNVLKDMHNYQEKMSSCVETDSETQKTLGVAWNPHHDYFQYSTTSLIKSKAVFKRNRLSYISQIFDSLGLEKTV